MSRSPPSESTRTREVLRCLEPFESIIQPFNFSEQSPENRVAVGSDDTALAAFAQLGALRMNAQRCMISLLSKDTEFVLAESTKTLSLQSDLVHAARDALWLGTTSFPKDQGLAVIGVDQWSTIRENRQTPDIEDHYYTDGASPHWLIVSDLRQEQHKGLQDRLLVKCSKSLRFYCAIPIRTPSGVVVGSFSVFDERPRFGVSVEEMEFLEDIADTITGHLEAKRAALQRKRGDRLIKGLALFNEGKDTLRDWWLNTYSRNVRGEGQRRRRRSVSDEDVRNERADEELGMTYRADEQGRRTPVRITTDVRDMADPEKSVDQLPPPPASAGVKTGHLAQEKFEGFDLGREVNAAFARGSNLIRESISSEGVVFVDADFARSKHATQNNGEASSTDPDSDSASSSPDKESQTQQNSDPTNESDCALLGFSTKIKSSLRGFSGSQKHASLPKSFVRSLIRRYPQGKVFNYVDGRALSSSSGTDFSDSSNDSSHTPHSRTHSSDSNRSSKSNKRKRRRTREAVDAMTIAKAFSDPRSVAFLPLWDSRRERWRSAAFVWNDAPNRLLDKTEDVTYLAAFGNSLMSELSRLDAIAADQAKATFISSVSHELRSPLHGVLAGVELLQESNLNTFQEEMTTTISMAGKTLLDTINNILDFTKINSFTDVQRKDRKDRDFGRNTSFKTADMGEVGVTSSVDLALLTETVVDTTVTAKSFQASKQQAADQPLDVEGQNQPVVVVLNIAKRPNWHLNISPGSWTRVLTNLLGNSLKYTKSGLITVGLSFEKAEKTDKTMVLLTIEDTGQGISSEYLRHHLYTPFMQENTHAVGTGLGLSIVKQIIHDFGGHIEFESELGRGTKVTVSMLTEFDEDAETAFEIPKTLDRNLKLAFSSTLEGTDREGRIKTVKSVASKTCRDWMKCQSEYATVKDGAAECDALVVTEPEYEEWARRRRCHDNKDPPLIVLSSISSSSSAARQSAAKNAVFINQPFGPRKLSRALAAALHSHQSAYQPLEKPLATIVPPIHTKPSKRLRSESPMPESPKPDPPRAELASIDDLSSGPNSPVASPLDQPQLRKILLVEDNAINMKLLVAAMRKLKRPYELAENGLEAVSRYAVAPHTFALVLMDISMPVMDGFVATETIRTLEDKNNWPHCLIIALTGVGDAEAKKRAFLSGVDTFLTKPASMKKLRGIVEELKD